MPDYDTMLADLGVTAPTPPKPPKESKGLLEKGNIDLRNRPRYQNPDGSVSTELSVGVEMDGVQVLLPRIIDGKKVSNQAAIDHYMKAEKAKPGSGEHLGKHDSIEASNAAAAAISQRQAEQVDGPDYDAMLKDLDAAPANFEEIATRREQTRIARLPGARFAVPHNEQMTRDRDAEAIGLANSKGKWANLSIFEKAEVAELVLKGAEESWVITDSTLTGGRKGGTVLRTADGKIMRKDTMSRLRRLALMLKQHKNTGGADLAIRQQYRTAAPFSKPVDIDSITSFEDEGTFNTHQDTLRQMASKRAKMRDRESIAAIESWSLKYGLYAAHAANAAERAFVSLPGDLARFGETGVRTVQFLQEKLKKSDYRVLRWMGEHGDDGTGTRKAFKWFADAYDELMQQEFIRSATPELEGHIIDQAGQAFGSALQFMAGGAVAKSLGVGARASAYYVPALLGAVAGGSASIEESDAMYDAQLAGAEAQGKWLEQELELATDKTQRARIENQIASNAAMQEHLAMTKEVMGLTAFYVNSVTGLTEAVPIGRTLNRMFIGAKGPIGKVIADALVEGTEEAIQETLQQLVANGIASVTYDERRELLEGVARGGELGFGVGAVMSLIGSASIAHQANIDGRAFDYKAAAKRAAEYLEMDRETMLQEITKEITNPLQYAAELTAPPPGAAREQIEFREGMPVLLMDEETGKLVTRGEVAQMPTVPEAEPTQEVAPAPGEVPPGEEEAAEKAEAAPAEEGAIPVPGVEPGEPTPEETPKPPEPTEPTPTVPPTGAIPVEPGLDDDLSTALAETKKKYTSEGEFAEPATDEERQVLDFLKRQGIKGAFVRDLNVAGATVAREGRDTVVLLKSGRATEAMRNTAVHEIAHRLQVEKKILEGLNEEETARLEGYKQSYLEDARRTQGDEAAAQLEADPTRLELEAVARMAGDLLSSPENFRRFVGEAPTLVQRVVKAFRDLQAKWGGKGNALVDKILDEMVAAMPEPVPTRVTRTASGDFQVLIQRPGGQEWVRAEGGTGFTTAGDAEAWAEIMGNSLAPAVSRPAPEPTEAPPGPPAEPPATEPTPTTPETPTGAPEAPAPTPPSITDVLSEDKQKRLEELKKRLREKLTGEVSVGIDPEIVTLGVEMGALYVEAGARKFGEWAKQMVDSLGVGIKPYLKSIYSMTRDWPGMAQYRGGMTGVVQVDALTDEQIDELLAEGAEAVAAPLGEGEPAVTPATALANTIAERLAAGETIDSATLFTLADEAFGGTRAEGTYLTTDAYDAMELGINLHLRGATNPQDSAENVKKSLDMLEALMSERIATQTIRSQERQEFQQFSTPPGLSLVAAWTANLQANDVVLEPSAGTGNLAVHALNANVASVIGNELEPKRRALLEALGLTTVLREDAEQIYNIMAGKIAPTVVLMNPPFSRAAMRAGDKQLRQTGAKHIEQALKLLPEGGRLVAIVGRGMAMTRPAFTRWWEGITKEYNVRANVGISGEIYKKMGTRFETQLLVIDKDGPTGKWEDIVTGKIDDLKDLVDVMEGIRNDRPTAKPAAIEPTVPTAAEEGEAGGRPGEPVQPPVGPVGVGVPPGVPTGPGEATGTPTAGARPGDVTVGPGQRPGTPLGEPGPAGAEGEPAGTRAPGETGTETGGEPVGGEPVGEPGGDRGEPGAPAVPVEQAERVRKEGELTDAVFEDYQPRIVVAGAQPHPGAIAESAAMAAVMAPEVTYQHHLPQKLIDSGQLSIVQLEPIMLAGQAHELFLPAGSDGVAHRRGFMDGDGTGVGKGRINAGIILDNFIQGRRKAVWFAEPVKLKQDALRDWKELDQDPRLFLEDKDAKAGKAIKAKEGILFMSYSKLGQATKEEGAMDRVTQLVDWLGEDFDGVIIFDESHMMGNVLSAKPAKRALQGVALQQALPNARFVYASATAATEIRNLAYAPRLGLWGPGTEFMDVGDFTEQVETRGAAAMELVSRDMKALGMYQSRQISYNGGTPETTVAVSRIEQVLSPDQTEIYNILAETWQQIRAGFEEALRTTGAENNATAKRVATQIFWASHQRFFNQIITSMKVPALIKELEGDLANERSALIQLTTTSEAAGDRALAKRRAEGTMDDLDDFDLTPRQELQDLVERHYPIFQYEDYVDPESGRTMSRLVKDSAGNPVVNPDALRMRDELLSTLGAIKMPESPLNQIINHFGHEQVAEITGRGERVIMMDDPETGKRRLLLDKRGKGKRQERLNAKEVALFEQGKKRILMFSRIGGQGSSYHADLRIANQQKRMHYLLEGGWQATVALQGLGRGHRSNQRQAPDLILLSTNLHGEKRFITTIARKLDSYGAVSRGERRAGSVGVFTAADNLETKEATAGLRSLFRDIQEGAIPEIGLEEFEQATGLSLQDSRTGQLRKTLPDMARFLNRLLSLKINDQNLIFDEFDTRHKEIVAQALKAGILDVGTEVFRADKIHKTTEKVVFVEPRTSAETKYVKLDTFNKQKPLAWEEIQARKPSFYVRSRRAGNIYAVMPALAKTTKEGSVVDQYRLVGPGGYTFIERKKLDGYHANDNWERLVETDAEAAWAESTAALPEFKKKEIHLITGVIMPIWNRLPSVSRVYRLQTDEGEELLGRVIPATSARDTLRALGAELDPPKLTPKQAFEKAMSGDLVLELANNWKVRRSRVSNEWRMELTGPDHKHRERLKEMGLFEERINYRTRYFIPTKPETGIESLKALFEDNPLIDAYSTQVEDEEADAQAFSGPGATQGERESGPDPEEETTLPEAAKEVTPTEPVSRNKIIKTMESLFGVPIRVGRIAQKKTVAGIYKVQPEVIRLRVADRFDVGTHEVAHHIDKLFNLSEALEKGEIEAGQAMGLELGRLDYEPEKGRTNEGFAEYIRYYLTEQMDPAVMAPNFHAWFTNNFLMEHPEIEQNLGTTRNLIMEYYAQGFRGRIDAQISHTGKPESPAGETYLRRGMNTVEAFGRDLRIKFEMEGLAIREFEKEMTGGGLAEGTTSPFNLFTWANQASGAMAKAFVLNGVTDMNNRLLSPGIKQALEKIPRKEMANFLRFIYARHALDVHAKGKDPGITLSDARAAYNEYAGDSDFVEAGDALTAYSNALVELLRQSGRISDKSAELILVAYPVYIPLLRVVESMSGSRTGAGKRLVNLSNPIKNLFGSGAQILNPLEAMIIQTERIISTANRAMIFSAVRDLANKAGAAGIHGTGRWIERVPVKKEKHVVKLERIQAQLEDAGADLSDADMTALIDIFTPVRFELSGQPVVKIYRKGKAEWYQLDPELYNAAMATDYYRLPPLLEYTLGSATRTLRLGATGLNQFFAARNVVRDVRTAAILTEETDLKDFWWVFPEIWHVSKSQAKKWFTGSEEDVFVATAKRYGLEMAQPLGMDRNSMKEALHQVMQNTATRRALNIARHPIEFMRDALSVTELGVRMVEFRSVLEKNGWTRERLESGERPPMGVVVEAIVAAKEVTINFGQAGVWGRKLNRIVPYLNANVQGVSKNLRTGKAHPLRTVARGFLYVTVPALASWWWYKDEDWYQEMEPWLKYGFHHTRIGDEVLRVPLPFEMGDIFGGLPVAAAEAWYKKEPEEVTKWFGVFLDHFVPESIPALVKPAVEYYFDYDFFRNRSIVPASLSGLEAEDQATPWNTRFAKKVGEITNRSPAKIEHVMSGYTGGLATRSVRSTEHALEYLGVMEETPRRLGYSQTPFLGAFFVYNEGSTSIRDFYKQSDSARRAYNSARRKDALTPPLAAANSKLNRRVRRMAKVRHEVALLNNDLTLTNEEREGPLRALQRELVYHSRQALGHRPLALYQPVDRPEQLVDGEAEFYDVYDDLAAEVKYGARPTGLQKERLKRLGVTKRFVEKRRKSIRDAVLGKGKTKDWSETRVETNVRDWKSDIRSKIRETLRTEKRAN